MKPSTFHTLALILLSLGFSAILVIEFLGHTHTETIILSQDTSIIRIEFPLKPGPHIPDPPLQNPLLGQTAPYISAGTTSTVQKHIKGMAFIVKERV